MSLFFFHLYALRVPIGTKEEEEEHVTNIQIIENHIFLFHTQEVFWLCSHNYIIPSILNLHSARILTSRLLVVSNEILNMHHDSM